jgi:hypothetical protein
MPLEAVTATLRANDRLATSLKLTWAEGLFHCCFYSAFNCCDGLVHNCVEVAERPSSRMSAASQTLESPESVPRHSLRAAIGSESAYCVEVKYEDGWGRHTRTDDKRWAEGIAKFLLTMYPETQVIPNAGTQQRRDNP